MENYFKRHYWDIFIRGDEMQPLDSRCDGGRKVQPFKKSIYPL